MKGEAEAFALEAKGRAEAEQMAKKAEAFKQYKDGAMVDMLLEKLPLVSTRQSVTATTLGRVFLLADEPFPLPCFLLVHRPDSHTSQIQHTLI